jgi:hypothetical protein
VAESAKDLGPAVGEATRDLGPAIEQK